GGQEAHEDGRPGRGPAGGVHRGLVLRRLQGQGQEVASMPSALPLGDPAPADGLLPAAATEDASTRDFYVHIPFCAVRCGYCDFNTYTAHELGSGSSQDTYAAAASAELEFGARVLRT